MSQPTDLDLAGDAPILDADLGSPPRHGFQGNRGLVPGPRMAPMGLAVCLSRESGARGGTIARLVADKLSWQFYDQELLEYMAQNPVIRQGMAHDLSPACLDWVRQRLHHLEQSCRLANDPDVHHLAQVVLHLGAGGQVVLVGRGTGCILPRESTLNVRIIAPLQDRIAFVSQSQRLSASEAAERIQQHDERRADFVLTHFDRSPGDIHQYDLVLNSSLLGEDGCAELIMRAALLRWAQIADFAG